MSDPTTDYLPLGYGLDEASPKQAPQPGRLLSSENFEIIFGEAGLKRCMGYERYDGQPLASAARYYRCAFTDGAVAVTANTSITTATGWAFVLRVAVTSGSWAGGDAAGLLILTELSGDFDIGQTLIEASATVSSFDEGVPSDDDYSSDITLARTHYRALIGKPAGQGRTTVALFKGVALALRDDVGGQSATLWKATSGGWSAVQTGLRAGGYLRAVVANFSGSAGGRKLYGCDGVNRYWQWDGASSFKFGPAVYGTESNAYTTGVVGTPVIPAGGVQQFSLGVYLDRTFAVGDELRIYGQLNAANWMVGTFVSLVSNLLTVSVTSFNNAGGELNYFVCLENGDDRPFDIVEHKNYLFLAYPDGQLQTTDNGSPLTFTTTFDVFPLGDEIAAMQPLRGGVLALLCDNSIKLLYGDGSTANPWRMEPHSEASNCRRWSSVDIGGDGVFISDAGIQTLTGSQAFGDFEASNIAAAARKSQQRICSDFRCATLAKSVSQYRIYGKEQQVLVMSFSGPPRVKNIAFTRLRYEHQPCSAASETVNGSSEVVVFGTDDGWVMRDRSGSTFDGTPIVAFFRTSYWHNKAPQYRKRWYGLKLDIDPAPGSGPLELRFVQDIDFSDPDNGTPAAQSATVDAIGARFDEASWDEFAYDGPEAGQLIAGVDGEGRYMSVTVLCEQDVDSFTVRGMHDIHMVLGLQR